MCRYLKNHAVGLCNVCTGFWFLLLTYVLFFSDEMIVLFLHSCYYKIEPTKNTIDNYFTIRTTATEIFCDRNPHSEQMREAMETL